MKPKIGPRNPFAAADITRNPFGSQTSGPPLSDLQTIMAMLQEMYAGRYQPNTNYLTFSFSVKNGEMQEILTPNDFRLGFFLFCQPTTAAASFVFDQSSVNAEPIDPAYPARAFILQPGDTFTLPVAPKNAITVLAQFGDTRGLIITGTQQ